MSQQNTRVPLLSIAAVKNFLETGRIRRREHFRTISILCFPAPGVLASEVLGPIESKLKDLQNSLPPGYQLQICGEKAKQDDGFLNLAVVLLTSLVGIYLALLVQFKNAVKPLLVFAAAPYGAIGALIALAIMGSAKPSTFRSMSKGQFWGNQSLQHEGLKSTKSWQATSTTLSERGAPRTSKYSTF
jgi:multidrug efflux pump subunit AcrB